MRNAQRLQVVCPVAAIHWPAGQGSGLHFHGQRASSESAVRSHRSRFGPAAAESCPKRTRDRSLGPSASWPCPPSTARTWRSPQSQSKSMLGKDLRGIDDVKSVKNELFSVPQRMLPRPSELPPAETRPAGQAVLEQSHNATAETKHTGADSQAGRVGHGTRLALLARRAARALRVLTDGARMATRLAGRILVRASAARGASRCAGGRNSFADTARVTCADPASSCEFRARSPSERT